MEHGREDPQDEAWAQRAPFGYARIERRADAPRRRPLLAIVAAHVVLLAIAARVMREDRVATKPPSPDVLVVELLPPEAQPDAPARAAPAAPAKRIGAPPTPVRAVESSSPPVPPAARLFDQNGALILPRADSDTFDAPATARPFGRSLAPARKPHPTVVYEATRFDRYFVRDHETLGQRLVRNVPLLGIVLSGVNAPNCGTDPDHLPEECDPQRSPQDLNTLTHPLGP